MSATSKSFMPILILVVFATGYALGSLDGGPSPGLEILPTAQAEDQEYSNIPCPRIGTQICQRNETQGYEYMFMYLERSVKSTRSAGRRVYMTFD